ncbi:MAG: hypothetical protein LBV43_09395 [Prevotella sp.]|jgi:hypothetical protein|nr:hypothetical protein [Prevotella sp.]
MFNSPVADYRAIDLLTPFYYIYGGVLMDDNLGYFFYNFKLKAKVFIKEYWKKDYKWQLLLFANIIIWNTGFIMYHLPGAHTSIMSDEWLVMLLFFGLAGIILLLQILTPFITIIYTIVSWGKIRRKTANKSYKTWMVLFLASSIAYCAGFFLYNIDVLPDWTIHCFGYAR